MIIAFVPFSVRCPQHANTGSIRIRVKWPMKYIKDSFVAMDPREAEMADVVILQKVYGPMINHKVRYLKEIGKKIVFDLCDPDWITMPTSEQPCLEMFGIADVITVPTDRMAKLVRKHTDTPVKIVKDGLDMEYHAKTKENYDLNVPPKIVWFGNRGTIKSLKKYLPDLEEIYDIFNFELKIISDAGEIETKIPWTFTEWNLETVNDEIMACDIAINTKLADIADYVKSRNKTYTAWACGVPCVEVWPNRAGFEDWKKYLLKLLKESDYREKTGRWGRKRVENKHDVRFSAKKLEEVCKNLIEGKYARDKHSNDPGERQSAVQPEQVGKCVFDAGGEDIPAYRRDSGEAGGAKTGMELS